MTVCTRNSDGPGIQEKEKTRMSKNRHEGRIRRRQPTGSDRKPKGSGRQAPGGRDYMRSPQFEDVSLVPAELLERAVRHKLPWIQRYVKEGRPRGLVQEYAEQAKEAVDLEGPVPPYTTLMTWARRYEEYGILGLVDSVPSHAGKSYKLDEDGKLLIRVAIIGGKRSITGARSFLIEHLGADDTPSYNTCLREVHRIRREEPHLWALAQHNKAYFKNVFRLAIAQGALPAGYRYEVDSTVADIWVRIPDPRNPGEWEAVRPVLTVVEDSGSRALLTFNLSLAAVDSGIILGTMQRAIDPEFNYPGLASLGIPHEVAVDKGSEHRGRFLDVMEILGVDVIHGIPNEPQGRARVERLIRTITQEVFAHMIGYSPVHKPLDPYAPAEADAKRTLSSLKYDPDRVEFLVEHLPTLPELEAKILAWATVYNDRPHRGLPSDSPELRRLLQMADQLDDSDTDSNIQEAA
jgi:transposase InsO family protein